ncbi:MAG TPA: alpha/beta hydrolase [Kofleriaceae bacterium]|nr:alpha/beta hydrolase [Kofleriaceae bacterium]
MTTSPEMLTDLVDDGRLARVTSFLDPVPAPRPTTITARDGAQLSLTDTGGPGAPVVFVHSWAMHGAMWQYQVESLRAAGLRCITYDRRGHGRSSAAVHGLDYDTLADDLAAVLDTLELHAATLVGHSSGSLEIVRYLARHGSARVARVALLAPTTPAIDRPAEVSAALHAAWAHDFPAWVEANKAAFFTAETSPAAVAWLTEMITAISVDVAIALDRALAAADVSADLAQIDRPTLILHGDRDASAPLALGERTAAAIPGSRLVVYEGAPHGLFVTHVDRVNADLRAFIA